MKKMPDHVAAQRGTRSKPFRGSGNVSELHDVFKRIDMHSGDKQVCWEWRGTHGKGTRGEYRPRVCIAGVHLYVYRVVYELYTGYTLQKGDVIRHQCDHSWCCNPHHMIIGTQADNVGDMLERERVGMKHFHIRRIMQMLEIGATAEYVSAKMKEGYSMQIDVSVVRKIRMRTIYKHIEWPWGDEYAAKRRERLAEVRKSRLAGVSTCAIIQTSTTGGKDASEDEDQTD